MSLLFHPALFFGWLLRYEDAVNSVKTGLEMGTLPGGGSALLYVVLNHMDEVLASFDDPDERTGGEIVLKALPKPIEQIARNAGINGPTVVERIRKKNEWGYGFNAATLKYEDLIEAGILDSAAVVVNSILNSASVASLILTTDCVISELLDTSTKKEAP